MEGESDSWDFGVGAGFYVNATVRQAGCSPVLVGRSSSTLRTVRARKMQIEGAELTEFSKVQPAQKDVFAVTSVCGVAGGAG